MKMQIGKWGNSFAVRLPKEVLDECGLKLGDAIDSEAFKKAVEITSKAEIQARKAAALEQIRKRQWKLPDDWKFDREEANWRPAMDRW